MWDDKLIDCYIESIIALALVLNFAQSIRTDTSMGSFGWLMAMMFFLLSMSYKQKRKWKL